MSSLTLSDVRYNAGEGAFEASAEIRKSGTTYRYPCSVAGPVTMDTERVRAGLVRHAERQSSGGARILSMI